MLPCGSHVCVRKAGLGSFFIGLDSECLVFKAFRLDYVIDSIGLLNFRIHPKKLALGND